MIDRYQSVAGLDLSGVFALAQNSARQKREDRVRSEQTQREDAYRATQLGFQREDRAAAQKFQDETQAETVKQHDDARRKQDADLAKTRAENTSRALSAFARMAPDAQAKARPYFERMVQAKQLDPIDFDNAKVGAAIGHAVFGKQEEPLDLEREIRLAGFDPATPDGQAYARKLLEGKGKGSSTTINVGDGRAGIEKTTKAKFEQDIATTDDLLSELGDVNKAIDSELVGFSGSSKEKVASAIDYFGSTGEAVAQAFGMDPDARLNFLERRQSLKTKIKDLGDRVLRVRSGANAPEPEVKKLESIMGSIDSMGERQLRVALSTFTESLQRQRNTKASAIKDGTQVNAPKTQAAPQPSAQDVAQRRKSMLDQMLQSGQIDQAHYERGIAALGGG